jgi:hypothetical protein
MRSYFNLYPYLNRKIETVDLSVVTVSELETLS